MTASAVDAGRRPLKVWIDLANSPHPLLFAPIAKRLRGDGVEVVATVRDHAQTIELAQIHFPNAEVIGGRSRDGRLAKAGGIAARVRDLRGWAAGVRPDVAVSHNSYAQLVAARTLRLPTVTAMDFEHQPANHIAFRCADTILVPMAVPVRTIRRQGARRSKLIRYEGLKEQLYLGDFEPDPEILSRLGVSRSRGDVLVVARTAPAGAAYHRGENPILTRTIELVARQEDVICIVLARHARQGAAIEALGLDRVCVPSGAVDSRSLLAIADLFLGAGGTMSREAALLGTPTYSLFDGPPVAVDDWLENRGLLRRLVDHEQIGRVEPSGRGPLELTRIRRESERLIELFARTIVDTGQVRPA